jgi:hypothetical protein
MVQKKKKSIPKQIGRGLLELGSVFTGTLSEMESAYGQPFKDKKGKKRRPGMFGNGLFMDGVGESSIF